MIELLYRFEGPNDALTGDTLDWDDYFAPCGPIGISEFNDPFEILEWFYERPELFGGKNCRMVKRHDVINLVLRGDKHKSICFVVIDEKLDSGWLYNGGRAQSDINSKCKLMLLPLRRVMKPFHKNK